MSNEEITRSFDYTTGGLQQAFQPLPCLTIVYHPDASRVGERSVLRGHSAIELSRVHLSFGHRNQTTQVLAEPHISRAPITIQPASDGSVRLSLPKPGYRLRIDGVPAREHEVIASVRLSSGVLLQLGKRVYVLLHLCRQEFEHASPPDYDALVGPSSALDSVRMEIKRVASLDVPVLIRGETGTGKELIARAIHTHSLRRARTYVPVNMAGVQSNTASSELFGHVKGAFTGATRDHDGHFGQADGGTLFLDEIGELDRDVQALMLRILESGELQRVGAGRPTQVNVRVVAATDTDLDAAVEEGRFIMPLFQRLNGYTIKAPPLRERREDIAVLLLHFLKTFLAETGETDRLDNGLDIDWIKPAHLARLVFHH